MNAWHQGRSPGRKGKFTDLFLSFSLSFLLWFVLSTFVFTLLCSISCPPSSSLHFFFSFYISPPYCLRVEPKLQVFITSQPPLLHNSVFSFCQKWFFHFHSAGLPSSILILQTLTSSFAVSVRTSKIGLCKIVKVKQNLRNYWTLNFLKWRANTLIQSGMLSFLRQTLFFSDIV